MCGAADAATLVPGSQVEVEGRKLRVEALVCGVDYGYRHAFVCLFIAMLRGSFGRVAWVYDELVTREQTVARNAAAMRARVPESMPLPLVYGDVAGNHTNSQTGRTDERVIRDAGFVTKSRYMEIGEGLDVVDGFAWIRRRVHRGC